MAKTELTLEQLQEKLPAIETEKENLIKELTAVREELAIAQDTIKELNRQNESMVLQRQFKTELPIVERDGVKYVFTADRFSLPGHNDGKPVEAAKATGKDIDALFKVEGQGILVALEVDEEAETEE